MLCSRHMAAESASGRGNGRERRCSNAGCGTRRAWRFHTGLAVSARRGMTRLRARRPGTGGRGVGRAGRGRVTCTLRRWTPARTLREDAVPGSRGKTVSDATGNSPQFAVFAEEGLPLGPGDKATVMRRMLSASGPGREVVEASVAVPWPRSALGQPLGAAVTVAGGTGNEEGSQQASQGL